LESALLTEFHVLYQNRGFPHPSKVLVVGRENTGAGRYVKLHTAEPPMSESGYLDLGGKFISMDGVPYGLMAVVDVSDGRPSEIEIAVYGEFDWDGEERSWSIG
jgi:hypothetical protein